MTCPFCGEKIRVNTKGNPIDGRTKQGACTDKCCGARGPMARTVTGAKLGFCNPNEIIKGMKYDQT